MASIHNFFLRKTPVLGAFLILGNLCSSYSSQAQSKISADTIADYEIPYVVGQAREMTLRLMGDLNSLHANIPEDAKATVYSYIYDAFEEGKDGRVLSDLKYDRPLYSLMVAAPISISKYALDYELDPAIHSIAVASNSFRFTFPENTGSGQFEMYGAYDQYFINVTGDTLLSGPLVKLAGFVAIRDVVSKRFKIQIRSIAFLDQSRTPDFMLPDELTAMTQKYFEWKNAGSSMDNLAMLSDEAFRETLQRAKEKRQSKESMLAQLLIRYEQASRREDVLQKAEEFLKAEKLQRNHPVLLRDKAELSQSLKKEIEQTLKRTQDARVAWNFAEAFKLAAENEQNMGLWSQLNGRKYDNIQAIKNLETEVSTDFSRWQESDLKLNNVANRGELKKELDQLVGSQTCSSGSENDELAMDYYMLGRIAEAMRKAPNLFFEKSIACKSKFFAPKLKLAQQQPIEEAMVYLNQLLDVEPHNPNYFILRGSKLARVGQTLESEQDFKKAVDIDPGSLTALYKLAENQIKRKEYKNAVENLEYVMYLDSSHYAAVYAAYSVLEDSQAPNSEAQKYVQLFSRDELQSPGLRILDSLMYEYSQQAVRFRTVSMQDHEAALVYEKMYTLAGAFPKYNTEWANAAVCYYDMGHSNDNFQRALFFAEQAMKNSNGFNSDALLIKGRIHRKLGEYREAKESLFKLLPIQNDFASNYELGETFLAEGRELVTARSYFQNALEKFDTKKEKNKQFELIQKIGICYRLEKNFALAEEQFKKATRLYPKRGDGYYQTALTLLANPDEKKVKKAFQYLEEAEKKGFDAYKLTSAKAETELKLRDYKAAKKTYETLRLKYESQLTLEDLMLETQLYIAQDNFKAAAENLKRLAGKNEKFIYSANYHFLQGMIALKQVLESKTDQEMVNAGLQSARSHFEEAISTDITHANAYLGLSMAAYYSDNQMLTMEALTKALNLGVNLAQYEDDSKLTEYFKSKEVKQKIKVAGK